jgi:hypothetical protein
VLCTSEEARHPWVPEGPAGWRRPEGRRRTAVQGHLLGAARSPRGASRPGRRRGSARRRSVRGVDRAVLLGTTGCSAFPSRLHGVGPACPTRRRAGSDRARRLGRTVSPEGSTAACVTCVPPGSRGGRRPSRRLLRVTPRSPSRLHSATPVDTGCAPLRPRSDRSPGLLWSPLPRS